MDKTDHSVFFLRIEHLWALAVLVGIFIFVSTHPIRPNDYWFHLAFGRILAQTGQIPIHDQFSFTMQGQPYDSAYSYWLAQWFMYRLYAAGGVEWSILVFAVIVTATYGILLGLALQETGSWRLASAGTFFAAALGITNWNVRPQLLVYFCAALCILGLQNFRSRNARLGWGLFLGVVMALWVNCHATFFIPLALAGFWLAETGLRAFREKKFSLVIPPLEALGFLLLGALINPRGYKAFFYIFEVSGAASVQQFISEWQPASPASIEGGIFFAALAIMLLLFVFSRRRPGLSDVLSCLFFAVLGVRYSRAIAWFGITQALLFVSLLRGISLPSSRKTPLQGRESPGLNIAFAVMLLALGAASLPWLRSYWPLIPEKKDFFALETPVQAVDYVSQHSLPEQVFSDIGFSSYIIWATDARYKVFSDPRFNLYPAEMWQDYIRISTAGEGWDGLLESYGARTLVLSPRLQHGLITAARLSEAWQEEYADPVAVVFVRRE